MISIARKLAPVLVASMFVVACSKNDDDAVPAPSITVTELGSDNSKIAFAGSDLHVDATLLAPGGIAGVAVEIHPEGASGWEFDSTYTEGFTGLKNATFHKHIDIPAEAAAGAYHVHFTITDQRGQKAEFEAELEIKVDPTLPTISGFAVATEDGGKELHVEGNIVAQNKIASVTVEVHGSAWEKEFVYNGAAMVGKTTYSLHEHIDISAAPAGHYHVHLKVTDQAGKEKEFEEHFDK
ncbi:hypothetical protein HNQ91_000127 [Filimonas zeae]|uniref:DUF4625 domain-containing protein n=1 Tax=Filimonas zeae TaxID=1737353 RepID=A0A917IKD9_9BACT|nr:DUF4625 domain-containing protein [Filimonas zeae]MDR6337105.1 hypothetical protein [Filimonas zeae]GGH57024.1 hypothetical protein GCM10011379_01250 [Filimonas zeae]